jgi:hypothetical protein
LRGVKGAAVGNLAPQSRQVMLAPQVLSRCPAPGTVQRASFLVLSAVRSSTFRDDRPGFARVPWLVPPARGRPEC